MTPTEQPPLRTSREVVAPPERAWRALTEEMGAWWPLGDFSASGSTDATVVFRDDVLVETAPDGTEHVWGEVLDWEPARRVRLTWHPGATASADATEVEFLVAGVDGGNRVEIVLAPLAALLGESPTG